MMRRVSTPRRNTHALRMRTCNRNTDQNQGDDRSPARTEGSTHPRQITHVKKQKEARREERQSDYLDESTT